MEKPKNTKKQKKSDPCPQPGLSPDLAHGCELFVFFCFFEVLAKLQKIMGKKKITKNSDPCPQPGLSQTLPKSEFFGFFGFLEILAKLQNIMEKNQKNKKIQKKKIRPMSPARPLPRPCQWV